MVSVLTNSDILFLLISSLPCQAVTFFVFVFMCMFFSSFARATGDAEEPDRIFVGGLPYLFTEMQIKQLLESFGYTNLY